MYDVSDRFLYQLPADRRESLLRSGRASTRRPLRRALRAGLARLGRGQAGRQLGRSSRSIDRGRAHGHRRERAAIRDGSTAPRPGVGAPAAVDVVSPSRGRIYARFRHGAQQA